MRSPKRMFQHRLHRVLASSCRLSMKPTVAFFAVLILWLATLQPSAAQPKQDFLAANIDPTVSPREDFFQYANGGWFKRNPIPADEGRWGIRKLAEEEIYSRLRRISEEAAAKKAPPGSDERLIGDFWSAGMDSLRLNKQGLTPLQPDLDRIDRIRSIRELIDFVAVLHDRNMNVLFLDFITPDQKNSDRYIYTFWQGGISMPIFSPQYYTATDAPTAKVRDAFRQYLFKAFGRLRSNSIKAKASADAVYDVEARLAKAYEPDDGYYKMGLTELQQLTPTIDWGRYFQLIGVTHIESVNMANPKFFQALDSLLHTVPLETWKDYLRFWLLRLNAPSLDDATFNDFFNYDRVYTGQTEPRPRWKRVLDNEAGILGPPLARLFLAEYFSQKVKSRHEAVAESIRDAFRDRISHLDWMSETTKQSALVKLARLKIRVGYPERWPEFSTMPIRRDSYAANMMRANIWFHDQEVRKLNQRVDKTAWRPNGTMREASYLVSLNEVRLGAGSLVVPGLRDEELDDAFIYGSTWLGHEISHAFDNEGRHYDASGNKVDWWTAKDSAEFNERAKVMIDEYTEFTPLANIHVDGNATLKENIADLAGVRIALDAFKTTEQFKKNDKIGGFTPLQRFFLAYAYRQLDQVKPEFLANQIRNDSHAPDKYRVNGILMNIPEFYEAFDVRPGDRMYRPENVRARIW